MNVLIVGINYHPEIVGAGVYTTGMAEALAHQGNSVTVITAPPHFPKWRIASGFRNWWGSSSSGSDGVSVVRCPIYIPKTPSGMRRILHYISFAISSFPAALISAIHSRPDVVIVVAPSLMSAPGAKFIAWLSGAKSWLHIQDFEVEAAMVTHVLKDTGRRANFARYFERWVLGLFDKVSTISPAMRSRLHVKGISKNKTYEFRNWSEMNSIKPLITPSVYRERLGISAPNVALYSGSIANKQGIEIILEAADLLKAQEDVCFVICGDGPAVSALKDHAGNLELTNIHFLPLQPKEQLNELLGLATMHLLPQIAGAADLVLPSKLTNMLASGRPVIATTESKTGLGQEVLGCGLLVPPGNASLLAEAIKCVAEDDALRIELGEEAVRRCKERWDSDNILNKFGDALRNICEDVTGDHRSTDENVIMEKVLE